MPERFLDSIGFLGSIFRPLLGMFNILTDFFYFVLFYDFFSSQFRRHPSPYLLALYSCQHCNQTEKVTTCRHTSAVTPSIWTRKPWPTGPWPSTSVKWNAGEEESFFDCLFLPSCHASLIEFVCFLPGNNLSPTGRKMERYALCRQTSCSKRYRLSKAKLMPFWSLTARPTIWLMELSTRPSCSSSAIWSASLPVTTTASSTSLVSLDFVLRQKKDRN